MSDTKQLFEILVKQIKLESLLESQDSFAEGKLNKLEVHKNSKRWTFFFEFKDVLPFNEFLTFVKALKASFDGIAQVNFEITTTNAELREKDIKDYWNYVLNDCGVNSPMVISRISQAALTCKMVMFSLMFLMISWLM
jgi:DNA polymerase III, alpha subunit (gram-positive type)